MKVGDLVRHFPSLDIGLIVYIFDNGDSAVFFADGVYQVDSEYLDVINEKRV